MAIQQDRSAGRGPLRKAECGDSKDKTVGDISGEEELFRPKSNQAVVLFESSAKQPPGDPADIDAPCSKEGKNAVDESGDVDL